MKIKIDYRSLMLAGVFSVISLIILIVGLATSIKDMDAFAVTIVCQLCIAGLWILTKWGAFDFKGMFSGTRKIINPRREKFTKEHNIQKEEKSEREPFGYIGPIAMVAFGIVEVIIYIIYTYI